MNKQKCFDCGTEFIDKPFIDVCPNCRSNLIIHGEPTKFLNLGDVNYLEYGGNLVYHQFEKEDCENFPELYDYCFNVIRLYTPWDIEDEKYLLKQFGVDVRDYEDKKKDILYGIGMEDKMDTPYLELFGDKAVLASAIVDAGFGELNHYLTTDFITLGDVKKFLCGIGIYIQ